MQAYLIFGPPGSGKGTQAEMLAKEKELKHLSTGELLRREIQKGTKLGEEAARLIDKGNLVSDEMALNLINKSYEDFKEKKGIILDGFPRTLSQVTILDEWLKERTIKLQKLIYLDIPDEEVTGRIMKRAALEDRKDDSEAAIIHRRIKIYHQETAPVLDFYKKRNVFVHVNGTGSIEEVFKKVCASI